MYVRKEALLSSQIEGTQCTLEDILNPLIEDNTNRDVSDVVNYIRATEFALERLKTLPLCNRLIKETHAVLFGKRARTGKESWRIPVFTKLDWRSREVLSKCSIYSAKSLKIY